MERRKFVIGLGSLAAGGAAAMGTSAFTSASNNDRDFSGRVRTDNNANALLRLNPAVSQYASIGGDGMLDVNIDGLTQNSTYTFPVLYRVVNNGMNQVHLSINLDNNPGGDIDAAPGENVDSGATTPDLLANELNMEAGERVDVGLVVSPGTGTSTFSGTFDVIASEP